MQLHMEITAHLTLALSHQNTSEGRTFQRGVNSGAYQVQFCSAACIQSIRIRRENSPKPGLRPGDNRAIRTHGRKHKVMLCFQL